MTVCVEPSGWRFVEREPRSVSTLIRVGADRTPSCGSGVTACHGALAMVIAGRDMPDVYVGSFSEWSGFDLPVVTGDHP